MAEKHSIKKSLAAALEIPSEVALDCARIIITGQSQLAVENHKGIIEYMPGKIVFKTAEGQAEILGENLTLDMLNAEALSIEGAIMAVCLMREDAGHEPR